MAYMCPIKFVTLEDVYPDVFSLNSVIYNPMLSKERNEEILSSVTHDTFHIDLTDDETDVLTSFDVHHLQDFIDMFTGILKSHWEQKS